MTKPPDGMYWLWDVVPVFECCCGVGLNFDSFCTLFWDCAFFNIPRFGERDGPELFVENAWAGPGVFRNWF